MLSSLDDGVGKVIKALKDSGHMKNTIVIFINDVSIITVLCNTE